MKIVTAILLAVCLATVCAALPLSAVGGRLTPTIAWLCLSAGVAGAAFYLLKGGPGGEPMKLGWPEWTAMGLFALFALRAFCWMVFVNGDSINVLSPNNLGDLPLHLTFIRYLAKGARFWPENPLYSGIALHYPAGIDIFNALLELVGCDDYRALIWVGLAGSALTCYALLRWGRWFAVMGFLCNGGLAGWRCFHHFKFEIADFQQPMAWKSIPLSMFVTQRGLLYALPAGLLLIATWRCQWFSGPDAKEDGRPAIRMPLWVQVALYGTMPLFHVHTFMFLSVLLGFWLLIGREGVRLRYEVLDLVLWAILPATICICYVTGLFQRGPSATGMIHCVPGWMQGDQPFFTFWFQNFGWLPVILAALIVWMLIKRPFRVVVARAKGQSAGRLIVRYPAFIAFAFPGVMLFLVCCYVMFAPWEWDNMKLMMWCYIAVLPFIHEALLLIPAYPGAPLRILCYVLLFFSGFISLIGGIDRTHTGYEIAKRSELDPVSFAVRSLPPDATFAGWPTYNHPLLLCGCKMVEGYAGHLNSYGIKYQDRLAALTRMMNGDADWLAVASSLHVNYLYWGPREAAAYPNSTQPWRTFPVVAAGDWGTIYDIAPDSPPPIPAAAIH